MTRGGRNNKYQSACQVHFCRLSCSYRPLFGTWYMVHRENSGHSAKTDRQRHTAHAHHSTTYPVHVKVGRPHQTHVGGQAVYTICTPAACWFASEPDRRPIKVPGTVSVGTMAPGTVSVGTVAPGTVDTEMLL